jgi:hypothetical protein
LSFPARWIRVYSSQSTQSRGWHITCPCWDKDGEKGYRKQRVCWKSSSYSFFQRVGTINSFFKNV